MIVEQKQISSPGTYIHPSVELTRDGSLIVLDTLHELIRFSLPTVFFRIFNRLLLGLGGLYAFLQAFDLIDRQSCLSEEQITHSNV